MHRVVFYSWQSDLPNRTNRSFIQQALENIAKSIRADDSIDVEPVIDRDTQGDRRHLQPRDPWQGPRGRRDVGQDYATRAGGEQVQGGELRIDISKATFGRVGAHMAIYASIVYQQTQCGMHWIMKKPSVSCAPKCGPCARRRSRNPRRRAGGGSWLCRTGGVLPLGQAEPPAQMRHC